MPDLSFLTNYFDIPLAINTVIFFWAAVQTYHMRVDSKALPIKVFITYIFLLLTALEAVTLMIFGIKGEEKSVIFYIISSSLLALFFVYSVLLIKRNFVLLKWKKSIRNALLSVYILLFLIIAGGPLMLDLLNIISYTVIYLYLSIFLIIVSVFISLKFWKNFRTSTFSLRISLPLIILKLLTSVLVFNWGFFDLDKMANQADQQLNTKLWMIIIGSVVLVILSLCLGISFMDFRKKDRAMKNTRNVTYFFIVLIIGFISAFCVLTVLNTERALDNQFKEIDLQADFIAATVDKNNLSTLTGTSSDLFNTSYFKLKDQLTAFANNSDKVRYIYIYGLNSAGKVVNYIEVQPDIYSNEDDVFKPGEIYYDASSFLMSLFRNAEDGFEGPLADSYGVWYTEFDPIVLDNNKVLMLGVDVEASVLIKNVFTERAETVAIMLFVFTLLIVSYDIYLVFGSTIDEVEQSQIKFKNVFDNSSDGILLIKSENIFEANKSALRFFGKNLGDLTGKSLLDLSPRKQDNGLDSKDAYNKILKEFAINKGVEFGWKFLKGDSQIYADISFNEVIVSGDALILVLIRDITRKLLADKEKEKYIEDLERLNKLMIGRELKMIQLKEEIRNLRMGGGGQL